MRSRVLLTGALTASVLLTAGPAWGRATDLEPQAAYQLPFRCGQSWTGTTRADHSPSVSSIDFNRKRDKGQPVAAAAPGVVTIAKDLGDKSYGRYVVIDHGNGESTLYAHLKSMWVVPGQPVDQATVVGQVGTTGGSTGPHLHFEERKNGTDVAPWFDGALFEMGTTITSRNCLDVPMVGDWDGDGVTDLGVYRRTSGQGRFVRRIAGTTSVLKFGPSYQQPITGDWDGDGLSDVGTHLAQKLTARTRAADGSVTDHVVGTVRDRVVVGDWDGDGADEVGLWRPATASFGVIDSVSKMRWTSLGSVGDLPVTGDWNGDGADDFGVFDPTTATWTLRYQDAEGMVWTSETTFGQPGDLPVVGDWDGDGVDSLGTWTPATAVWTRQGVDTVDGTEPTIFGRAR